MKTMMTILILSLAASVAVASCPENVGLFASLNGPMSGGRVSESFAGGAAGMPGNTENAMSWDGVTLGGEWKVWGMTINSAGAVEISSDLDVNGNGWVEYRTDYDGGEFWLSKDGLWGDGWNDLTGVVQNYTVTTKVTMMGGQAVGSTSNIYFSGQFGESSPMNGCVIEYAIANAMANGFTDGTNYPAMLGGGGGEYFDVCCISTSISCVVSNELESFGELKARFR